MAVYKKKVTDRSTKSSGPIEAGTGKEKALDLALLQIEKQFGKGAIMKFGQVCHQNIAAISTGSLPLDIATGIGGVPRGRIVEIFGPESSGKTTLTLSIIAQLNKVGGVAAFIDAEHALDPKYAERLGVKLDDLLISQPDTGEQALQIVEMLVKSNSLDLIVIDSVAALVPRAEIEGDMGDSHMGLQARLMSQALRKLTGVINRSRTCVIFINQIREKIGVMFGNPETTPGGKALKFYASMRLDIRRIGAIKKGDEIIGNRVRVKVVKNKVAPPFKQAEFDVLFAEGISRAAGAIDLGLECELLEKSGTWISYGEHRLGQGRESSRQFLMDNPKILDQLEAAIIEKLTVPPVEAVKIAEDDKAAVATST